MKVILFGASGMVGRGVLRECLQDPGVEAVLAVGRNPSDVRHPKLRELIHQDLWHYEAIETELDGYDACFFCLGVSAGGMAPELYERLTYGITLAAGTVLARRNPGLTAAAPATGSAEHHRGNRPRHAGPGPSRRGQPHHRKRGHRQIGTARP